MCVIIKTVIIDPTEDVQSQGQEVHLEKERSVEVGQEVQEGGLDQGRKEGLSQEKDVDLEKGEDHGLKTEEGLGQRKGEGQGLERGIGGGQGQEIGTETRESKIFYKM